MTAPRILSIAEISTALGDTAMAPMLPLLLVAKHGGCQLIMVPSGIDRLMLPEASGKPMCLYLSDRRPSPCGPSAFDLQAILAGVNAVVIAVVGGNGLPFLTAAKLLAEGHPAGVVETEASREAAWVAAIKRLSPTMAISSPMSITMGRA